jgi:hypothetical protein
MGGESPTNMNVPPMGNSMMPEDDMDEQPDMNMPPQNDNMMSGNEIDNELPMGNEMEMDGNEEMSGESDSTEIQSMSGKLANALRGTENKNDKKFAAGMINAAAIEGLSSQDRKDILKKINSNEGDDNMTEHIIFTKKQINEIRKEK